MRVVTDETTQGRLGSGTIRLGFDTLTATIQFEKKTFALFCAGIYFFFVIVLCVLSAITTTFVMHLHNRAESTQVTSMAPWVSCFKTKTLGNNS